MYYLQTRYYDPETGRFISMDSIEYLDPESIHGLNLYAYCANNPVINIDFDGHVFFSALITIALGALIGGVISGAVELGSQLIAGNGIDLGKIGLAFLGGAVAGAITAIPIPGFQALGVWGKILSYGLTFVAGAAGTLASGAITGTIDFNNGWSVLAGVLIGGFANVAARGISDIILGKNTSKILNQSRKAKSLTVQKLQGHRLNMGASALKGNMRNAFKNVTRTQVMKLLKNVNPLFRYEFYSSLNSAFLSGIPYMFIGK